MRVSEPEVNDWQTGGMLAFQGSSSILIWTCCYCDAGIREPRFDIF